MAFPRPSILLLLLLLASLLLRAGPAEAATADVQARVRSFFDRVSKVLNGGGGVSGSYAFVCNNSTLPGYTSSYKLTDGLTIHWVPAKNSSELKIAVEARRVADSSSLSASATSADQSATSQALPAKGWFSVGWSQSGAMYPGDAVVGNQLRAAVAAYSMTGHDASAVRRTNDVQLGKTSLARSGSSLVMRLSRFENNGGVVPFNIRGFGVMIWAYASDGSRTLGVHDNNRGMAEVDFSCDATAPPPVATTSSSSSSSSSSASSASSGSSCKKSSLSGYQYQRNLEGSSLVLHWKAAAGKEVEMAVEAKAGSAAKDGWMSLAWSGSSGRMVPSDAVIGNLYNGGIYPYKVSGYSTGSVKQGGFEIGSKPSTKTEGGSIIMRFSRTDNTGWSNKFKASGNNKLLWAYSSSGSNSLGSHGGNYGRLTVDFSCPAANSSAPSSGNVTPDVWWWPRPIKGVTWKGGRKGRGGDKGGGCDDDDDGDDD